MAELMDVTKRVAGISSYVHRRRYVLFSYGQAWHGQRGQCVSSASLLHLLKHLEHPPPNPMHAAAAFANTDGCLEDGDAGRDGGSGVGLGQGWVTWQQHPGVV